MEKGKFPRIPRNYVVDRQRTITTHDVTGAWRRSATQSAIDLPDMPCGVNISFRGSADNSTMTPSAGNTMNGVL